MYPNLQSMYSIHALYVQHTLYFVVRVTHFAIKMRFKTSSVTFCRSDVGIVVRKPLEAWMNVCTVCRKTPRNGDQLSKQMYHPSKNRILGPNGTRQE